MKKFEIGNRVLVNQYGLDGTVIGTKYGRYIVKLDFPALVGQATNTYMSTLTCCNWELSVPCAVVNQR